MFFHFSHLIIRYTVFLITFLLFACQSTPKLPQCDDFNQIECLRLWYTQKPQYWPKPNIDDDVEWSELNAWQTQTIQTTPIIQLGEALFFEKRLSSDGTISCASCHQPELAFSDNKPVSEGVHQRKGKRNSMPLFHLQSAPSHTLFFWDGRAKSLEEQSLMPLADPNEMDISADEAVRILKEAGYAPDFQAAFGRDIDKEGIATALSAYEQTLQPTPGRFDAFVLGEANALTDQELHGLHLFRTKARCINCHHGVMFTDYKMHNLNQSLPGQRWQDFGRYEITGDPDDVGKFKTPSLRHLSQTKPWFHHGLFINLEGIVAMYNIGMRMETPKKLPFEHYKNQAEPLIQPLGLSIEERRALVAFLLTL